MRCKVTYKFGVILLMKQHVSHDAYYFSHNKETNTNHSLDLERVLWYWRGQMR
jgi:hypothetical protein